MHPLPAAIAVLVASATLSTLGTETADEAASRTFWGQSADNAVEVGAALAPGTIGGAPTVSEAVDLLQSIRAPVCIDRGGAGTARYPCPGDPVIPLEECGDAATLPPLWQRTRPTAQDEWTAWEVVGTAVCATQADITPGMVLAEFRRLPLEASGLVVQPDRGWLLVNKPTVVTADPAPQTLATTILGIPVTITATPASYAWDFGDGARLETADPGRPWPDATHTHTYARTGTYRIALTTTWSATFTVAGDATARDVPGTATTTGTTGDLVVQERRAHLVSGACAAEPAAPGC